MTKPALNPIEAPDLICIECSTVMRKTIKPRHNGKLDAVVYSCDTPRCQYSMSVSLEHKNAQNVRYEAPESGISVTAEKVSVPTGSTTTVSTEDEEIPMP